MSVTNCAATELVDGQVLPVQFTEPNLQRDMVWDLQEEMRCRSDKELDDLYPTRVTIESKGGERLVELRDRPKLVMVGLSNEDIVEKWRAVIANVIDDETQVGIGELVLNLDRVGGGI